MTWWYAAISRPFSAAWYFNNEDLKTHSPGNLNIYTLLVCFQVSYHRVGKYGAIEFSRNTQSWQHWHFCTTSNVNNFETAKSSIYFNAHLPLSWCVDIKLKSLISSSSLFSNLSNTKMSTLPTLCITGKTRLLISKYV